jgi:PAS domain S-box-containing protein
VLAPLGRDAIVASDLLREVGVEAKTCASLGQFAAELSEDVGVALVTEEAIRTADLRSISEWVDRQPAWSDLPFIVLTKRTGGVDQNPLAARLAEILGNATFLERPFHPTTFVSLAKSAIKGRRRQYEARARLDELHESEERLQTAITAGNLGSWELTLKDEELFASNKCKGFFGRSPPERFSYGDLLETIHPDDLARMQAAVRKAVAAGGDYAIEYRVVWPDKTIHWVEIRARVVIDRSGGRRMVGVSSDITQRKTFEESLRGMNETLERRVIERTAELDAAHKAVIAEIAQRELAEEKLRQSQKMEMIGQLTGGVAHDFNNLLMAVIANLDLLKNRISGNDKAARLIDSAMQGARRGASLTQRLLAFARRQDLTTEPHDAVALVENMRELIERSLGPTIEMHLQLPARPLLALMDVNQVELALLNLVVNARDAMPDGGALRIIVEPASVDKSDDLKAGSYARITVIDTGTGMDSATLKRATEPFFSTKELGKGTGLGLSMIHGLALQLNGALRLQSKVGQGTRAELWMPTTDRMAAAASVALPSQPDRAGPSGLSILVVDDDALVAMSTVDMLEELGHDVAQASGGHEALALLNSDTHFDLLLTDYSMPKMNGAELAKAARDLRPSLRLIIATGFADLPEGEILNAPKISKPYQQADLNDAILRVYGLDA